MQITRIYDTNYADYMNVLGVRIDGFSKKEAFNKVVEFLVDGKQHAVFTPNPEMLVKAQGDSYFKEVLNKGDLNLCDGFGLWLVSKVQSRKSKVESHLERIPGTDFMLEICRLAAEQGKGVYLLGSGSEEVIRKTAENLQKQFSNLKIVGWDKGPMIDESETADSGRDTPSSVLPLNGGGNRTAAVVNLLSPHLGERHREGHASLISHINETRPDIIFVAFGMGKQEKWIAENLPKLPGVKVAMGVGGAFDYISGKVKRAPLLMRKLGLEWVYRLFKQPRRVGRIFNATVKFIYLNLISQ